MYVNPKTNLRGNYVFSFVVWKMPHDYVGVQAYQIFTRAVNKDTFETVI